MIDINQGARDAIRARVEALEAFVRAYLDRTGLSPDDVCLIQQTRPDGATCIWIEPKATAEARGPPIVFED